MQVVACEAIRPGSVGAHLAAMVTTSGWRACTSKRFRSRVDVESQTAASTCPSLRFLAISSWCTTGNVVPYLSKVRRSPASCSELERFCCYIDREEIPVVHSPAYEAEKASSSWSGFFSPRRGDLRLCNPAVLLAIKID